MAMKRKGSSSATAFLSFYVFKQNFINTDGDFEEYLQNLCQYAEAAKERSWWEFWQNQGNDLVLHTWRLKYNKYIEENQEEREVLNTQAEEEVVEEKEILSEEIEGETLSPEENHISWETLWEEHTNAIYCQSYQTFEEIYENYFWILKESLQDRVNSKEETDENFLAIEEELEQLRLAGLPTAFGSSRSQQKKFKQETVETKPPKSFYYSSSDTNSDFEDFEMPPIKLNFDKDEKPSEDSTLESLDDIVHRTLNKTIEKPKRKRNRKQGNIPAFMLEDKKMLKYWRQRFSLFSRFDEGIVLDRESWFSVTPEKVAQHMAQRLACDTIIDGFCGSGGNAIQFAMTCNKVVAIDIDPAKIEMARHNAEIYGVADKIDFIQGDFLELSSQGQLKGDIVFLSPPWGGPEYTSVAEYNIEKHLEPIGASELMGLARNISQSVAIFLPRHSNVKQIVALAGVGNSCEVEHNYLGSRIVGLTAFYGEEILKK